MAIDVSAASYESGRRALQLAVDGGSSSIQEMASLLAQEAEEHMKSSLLDPGRDSCGWADSCVHHTALQIAASEDHANAVERLLEAARRGFETTPEHNCHEATDCVHHTALEVASAAGHLNAVERLLAAGADPSAPIHHHGTTALREAAAHGHLGVVRKLLEAGADTEQCDKESRYTGKTPLVIAATAGQIEICAALVESGADVSGAIEAVGKTWSTTLLDLVLGVVEGTARAFDPDELELAKAEGRHEETGRLLRTKEFLDRAQLSMDLTLQAAAATGDMYIIQRLLDAGAEVLGAGRLGRFEIRWDTTNAIATAASGGHLEATNKLLQTASDRNVLTEEAVTAALRSAMQGGNAALIEPLLQHGADPTDIDIRAAAAGGHLDVLASMLQFGAKIDTHHFGFDMDYLDFTPLQLAAYRGHQAVVDFLLAKGADVNYVVEERSRIKCPTALLSAVYGGHFAVTKRLIDAGANLQEESVYDSDTPLQAAVRMGNMEMFELLMEAGADVDACVGGETVYVNTGSWKMYGGKASRPARRRVKTALSVAAEVGSSDLVVRLLSMMSPECAHDAIPWALQEAAENHHADVVKQLLQMHPDVNMSRKEKGELTFLQTAAANGNLEILEMLLVEGADANLNPSEGWKPTALQSASERGDLAAVKLLLAAGAEVNATGSTAPPLLLAIRGGHVRVFEHLLAAGADIHATAYRGQTMLEAAEDSGDAGMQERLRAALHSSPPPPQIDQPLDRATGPLCGSCRSAPLLEMFWSVNSLQVVLHPSLTALRASAAAGCPLCCFLWKRLGLTSISIPQPSPVTLVGPDDESDCYIACLVEEPFPREKKSNAVERLFVTLPTFREEFDNYGSVPITEDTSSSQTYEKIHIWLDGCKNDHPRCRAPLENSCLPNRLIYLEVSTESSSSSPTDTSLQPRLVSTEGMEYSECRYIALSYRWPEHFPVEAKSRRDNVCEQMHRLDTSKLPQIFNDVFQVAVRMGISYVWIDSLCIIQDDPDDWNIQAARMIQVYRYAEFTVAAAIPPTNPDLGLFRYGNPSDIPFVVLSDLRDSEGNETDKYVAIMKNTEENYGESPLVSRGWCFQEREISQRIVYYTENQVLWECRTGRASERAPRGLDREHEESTRDWPLRMLDQELNDDGVLKAWHRAVEDYSARKLTVFTDKLPALSGLAAAIRDYKPANCRYLAGLWEDNFVLDLQWYSSSRAERDKIGGKSTPIPRYPEYVAPTWSWASVAGPISYDHVRSRKHDANKDYPEFVLNVLDVSIETSTSDPFGAVKHAVLTCTAGLVPVVLGAEVQRFEGWEYKMTTPDAEDMGHMFLDVDPKRNLGEEPEVFFSVHLAGRGRYDVFREPHMDDYGGELELLNEEFWDNSQGPGLILSPTGNKANEYRRVGVTKDLKKRPQFFTVEIKEITII